MIKFEYRVKDELGIHARPAGSIARIAKGFESEITLFCGNKSASASKLIAMMGLGVKKGDTVTVIIEGSDEEAAEKTMRDFFEGNL